MPHVVCHGGSASNPEDGDAPRLASQAALDALAQGKGALEAVVLATTLLEDDSRFNAGTGSNLRFDGKTIQMDASCMTSDGSFGAVAAIELVKNPILVARAVMATPHVLLAGDGATAFARRCGFAEYDPATPAAKERLEQLISVAGPLGEWSRADLERAWNFETPIRVAIGGDTVGCVAWDGKACAVASSSGGTTLVLRGRVGDVPLPGCGLYAGASGAVAVTGDGEFIARSILAYRAHAELARGCSPEEVVAWSLGQLDEAVDVGIIVIDHTQFAAGARHQMAWHGCAT